MKHSGAEQRNKMPGNNKNHGGERKNAGRMPAFVKGQQTIFGSAANAAKTKKRRDKAKKQVGFPGGSKTKEAQSSQECSTASLT